MRLELNMIVWRKYVHVFGTLLMFLFVLSNLAGQNKTYVGKIQDAKSLEALAFVSVGIKGNSQGTTTDLDGNFSITASSTAILVISYVGYSTKEVPLKDAGSFLLISLSEDVLSLPEVTIRPKENPAWGIIRKVLANRPQNNPEEYKTYQYTSYNKSSFTVADFRQFKESLKKDKKDKSEKPKQRSPEAIRRDSIISDALLNKMYLWVKESVVEVFHKEPTQDKERIIASKSSLPGDFSMGFAASDFQPFGFYKEVMSLTLASLNFVNPISDGTFNRYDFQIQDTIYQGQDSTFVIFYQPYKGKNFDGLRGVLHINSNGYAMENVIASPADTSLNIQFRVQQQYKFNGKFWFPEILQTELNMPVGNEGSTFELQIRNRTQVKNPRVNEDIPASVFNYATREQEVDAKRLSEEEWNALRLDTLSEREQNSYSMWDSIPELKGPRNLFRTLGNTAKAYYTGMLPIGQFEIPLRDVIGLNGYEGYRLGLALRSNFKGWSWLQLRGYVAYGLKDEAWKYGLRTELLLSQNKDLRMRLSYRRDVNEPGSFNILSDQTPLLGRIVPRNWIRNRMDSIESFRAELFYRPSAHLQLNPYWRRESRQTTYPYSFVQDESVSKGTFQMQEVGFNLRFAPKEWLHKDGITETIYYFTYPVFDFQVAQGRITGVSDPINYTRLILSMEGQNTSKALGRTVYRIMGGMMLGNVPYPYLFNAPGVRRDAGSPIFSYHVFQTMGLYEFAGDRFAYLFFEHNFGKLLLKIKSKYSQPEIALAQNIAWGNLMNPEAHQELDFKTLDKGFYETGVYLRNLLLIPILKAAKFSAGVGAFYRWGPYSLENERRNFAYQVNFYFTL
ncbi:MAG: DUF5686 family protein [Haliscomenobacter sp.]|uniref:DUF5686 and carboxypeptidase-like regulatory domain-containing protein n=1 Tax=Haliscomenobacter sp. TaxID=2717303 RepID=UPI0029BD2C07|nr:DUF5686 family protein [Haliscomenobacter sp.]MDX2068750.1 DUF5686 family protein [Haliscomenobacter sp.]